MRAVRPGVQGRGRGNGEDRGGPEGVPSDANLLSAYASSPSWRTPAASSASGSTAGLTGRLPQSPGTGWRRAGDRGTRCRLSRMPWLWARSGWWADDQTVRFGSVRHSTPPGHPGTRVWCRAAREELVITARTGRGARGDRPAPAVGPGQPADPRRALPAPSRRERAPAAQAGGRRPRRKRSSWPSATAHGGGSPRPPPPARPGSGRRWPARSSWSAVVGAEKVDAALGLAAIAGRFADSDLASIIDHLAAERGDRRGCAG